MLNATKHKPKSRAAESQHYVVLRPSGQLDDKNFQEFESALEPLMKTNHSYVVFDLGDLELINSKIIGYFAVTQDRLQENNKKVVFINANRELLQILDLVGLTQSIPHFEHEEALMQALEEEEL